MKIFESITEGQQIIVTGFRTDLVAIVTKVTKTQIVTVIEGRGEYRFNRRNGGAWGDSHSYSNFTPRIATSFDDSFNRRLATVADHEIAMQAMKDKIEARGLIELIESRLPKLSLTDLKAIAELVATE